MLRIQTAVPPGIHSSRTQLDPSTDSPSARIAPASFSRSDPYQTQTQTQTTTTTSNTTSARGDPAWGAMNGVGTAPQGTMYVRALYDYEADDQTSLSFHEGDVIQVITQLESGWWDGVINQVRGWFPSNYCQIITSPDDLPELGQNGHIDQVIEDEPDEPDIYDDNDEQDDDSEGDGPIGLPLEGVDNGDTSFWIPQATPDGRLFYYNMMTGDRSMELPLESPVSANETGPRDRMNVNIPDQTRPPPEMMARGLIQDEDDDSMASASEAEGDSRMFSSRRSNVRTTHIPLYVGLDCLHSDFSIILALRSAKAYPPQHPWTRLVLPLKWVEQETRPLQTVTWR